MIVSESSCPWRTIPLTNKFKDTIFQVLVFERSSAVLLQFHSPRTPRSTFSRICNSLSPCSGVLVLNRNFRSGLTIRHVSTSSWTCTSTNINASSYAVSVDMKKLSAATVNQTLPAQFCSSQSLPILGPRKFSKAAASCMSMWALNVWLQLTWTSTRKKRQAAK